MGVLALGLAYVILRDKIYDQAFIDRFTQDFRQGGEDFWAMVTRDYSPERVSDIPGVPAQTILRLAREFGSAKAPLALSGCTSASSETGLFSQWAVASLNALSGSFSAKGLWRDPTSLPWGPPLVSAFSPRTGAFSRKPEDALGTDLPASWVAEQLPDLAAAGKIPDLEILLIAQVNPVFQASNQKAWRDWLSRIPLVVQFATLVDDTSPHADLVLPLTTYLEQWDLTLPIPNLPFSLLGLQQPIIPPLPAARPPRDILLRLGRGAGIDRIPERGEKPYGEYVQERMKKIIASGKGTPYFEEVSLEFLEDLRKRGWQGYSYPAFADFWRLLREKGGWWDPGEYPALDWKGRKKFLFPTAPRLAALLKETSIPRAEGGGEKGAKTPHLWLEERIRRPNGPGSFLLRPLTAPTTKNGDGGRQPPLEE